MVCFPWQMIDIRVVVLTMYSQTYDSQLVVNDTCTIKNFQVQLNESVFKPSNHKFLLKFTGGTTAGDTNKHHIPDKVINFIPLCDIITEKWKKYALIGNNYCFPNQIKGLLSCLRQPHGYLNFCIYHWNGGRNWLHRSKLVAKNSKSTWCYETWGMYTPYNPLFYPCLYFYWLKFLSHFVATTLSIVPSEKPTRHSSSNSINRILIYPYQLSSYSNMPKSKKKVYHTLFHLFYTFCYVFFISSAHRQIMLLCM